MSNKSEATWHPNSAPEVPHADLIARLRGMARNEVARDPMGALTEAADALAALGDTVPREQYDRQRERADAAYRQTAEVERAQSSLVCVIEQIRSWDEKTRANPQLGYILSTTPAVSLALHDAEVKAQALDEAREAISTKPAMLALPERFLAARAAAIREEAK